MTYVAGKCFVDLKDDIQFMYGQYCRNHDSAIAVLEKVRSRCLIMLMFFSTYLTPFFLCLFSDITWLEMLLLFKRFCLNKVIAASITSYSVVDPCINCGPDQPVSF